MAAVHGILTCGAGGMTAMPRGRLWQFAKEYGISWLVSDFKKKNGYKRSIELSAQYDLYRQDYCGCIYSKQEREKCKAERKCEA